MWLRGKDLNQRPPGYEPDELPAALPRDEMMLTYNMLARMICQAIFAHWRDLRARGVSKIGAKRTKRRENAAQNPEKPPPFLNNCNRRVP